MLNFPKASASIIFSVVRVMALSPMFRVRAHGSVDSLRGAQACERENFNMRQTLPAPTLEHLCDLAVTIAAPVEVGDTPSGMRRMIPITGGRVSGPQFNGRVLPGGADFQLILNDGTQAHLDARYVIELDDGSRVWVQNTALRVASAENARRIMQGEKVDPDAVYFRCQPQLETAAAPWAWLNDSQFIGTGQRAPDGVYLSFYRVC